MPADTIFVLAALVGSTFAIAFLAVRSRRQQTNARPAVENQQFAEEAQEAPEERRPRRARRRKR